MLKLVICDMAGTTINDRDEVYRVLREATERAGARYSDAQFQEYMGTEKRWAIIKLLEIGGVESTENPPEPLPGVVDTLTSLREQGVQVGLTTGFSRGIVDIILDSMGWGVASFGATPPRFRSTRSSPAMKCRMGGRSRISLRR